MPQLSVAWKFTTEKPSFDSPKDTVSPLTVVDAIVSFPVTEYTMLRTAEPASVACRVTTMLVLFQVWTGAGTMLTVVTGGVVSWAS